MNFDRAFDVLVSPSHEGGYSKDFNDRGNWTTGVVGKGELKGTKYGISAMTYPDLDIKNLSLAKAKEIYKRDWWDLMQLDSLPSSIAFDMFDTAVNSGISNAVRILQKTIGADVDGKVGEQTLSLAHNFNPIKLNAHFNANRLLFMTNISSWNLYGKGWARRVANNILLNS